MAEPSTHSDFAVKINPRSSRNKLTLEGSLVRAWVTSPPVDGEANEALIKLLSKTLGVAPSLISIVRGETGRDKIVRVQGKTWDQIAHALQPD